MAQLMPLPLTVSCFSKIQFGFTFLVPAYPGSPGKRAVKRVCVCVCSLYSNNTYDDDGIYGAVIMAQSHCESSPGLFDECRLCTRWLPTLRPSQTCWSVSPLVGCYHPHPPLPFCYYSFYHPVGVEG